MQKINWPKLDWCSAKSRISIKKSSWTHWTKKSKWTYPSPSSFHIIRHWKDPGLDPWKANYLHSENQKHTYSQIFSPVLALTKIYIRYVVPFPWLLAPSYTILLPRFFVPSSTKSIHQTAHAFSIIYTSFHFNIISNTLSCWYDSNLWAATSLMAHSALT